MIESKLMSYITSDFQTKSDMIVAEKEWSNIIESMSKKFKSAGAIHQIVSQFWNKEGIFRLGHMWEYKDEKAFIECHKLFREVEMEFNKKTGMLKKCFQIEALF
jgi:hypothetical protein